MQWWSAHARAAGSDVGSHRDLGLENRWPAPALGRGDAMRAQLGGKEVGGDENYLLANMDDGGGHVCGRDRKEVGGRA